MRGIRSDDGVTGGLLDHLGKGKTLARDFSKGREDGRFGLGMRGFRPRRVIADGKPKEEGDERDKSFHVSKTVINQAEGSIMPVCKR